MKKLLYFVVWTAVGAFASGAESTVTPVAFSDPSSRSIQFGSPKEQWVVHGDASRDPDNVSVRFQHRSESTRHFDARTGCEL